MRDFEFGTWLVQTGQAVGYRNASAIANALGVPQPTVSRWKSGAQPSVDHLAKVSQIFGIRLDTLLVMAGYLDAPPDEPHPSESIRLPEGHVAVAINDVLALLHGPIGDPGMFMGAANRLHLACLPDVEIVEEEDE